MEFNFFKEVKTRYLILQIIAVTILSVPAMFFFMTGTVKYNRDTQEFMGVIITVLWFVLVLRFLKKNNINILRFIGKPVKNFVLEVPAVYLLVYAGGIGLLLIIYYIVYKINPGILNSVQASMSDNNTEKLSTFGMISMFIGSVIAAPVTEEFIFRGILLSRLRSKYNIHLAIFISSLIFMVVHFNPNPVRFLIGIISCILVFKYRSIVPSILLHALNNLIAFLGTVYSGNSESASDNFHPNAGICVVGVVLVAIYVIYIYKNYPKNV